MNRKPNQSSDRIVQRWRDLRGMLIEQLDMFETGALTLKSNGADVAPSAISDLRLSILQFDAMISGDKLGEGNVSGHIAANQRVWG